MGNVGVSLTEDAIDYFRELTSTEDVDKKIEVPKTLRVHFVHNDIVDLVPIGFKNIGSSDMCGVQG
jgi:hypothetical protein